MKVFQDENVAIVAFLYDTRGTLYFEAQSIRNGVELGEQQRSFENNRMLGRR